jgi:hypothetical protein
LPATCKVTARRARDDRSSTFQTGIQYTAVDSIDTGRKIQVHTAHPERSDAADQRQRDISHDEQSQPEGIEREK